jgi:Leucine-rich repeat (LRR) protein
MLLKCFGSLKNFINSNRIIETNPFITLIYLEEIEEIEIIEDFILFKQKIWVEKTEKFDSVSKLLEFNKKESVIKLSLRNMNISDISFLEMFPNLISLDLSFNNIKDLEPINNLKKLKKLNISYNLFDSVKGLENCTNLEQLYMVFNNISDITELKYLSSLKTIDLENTEVKSIDILDELKYLEYIYTPLETDLGKITNKLKNHFTFSELIGKGITSSKLFFNRFYLLTDGINYGRKTFSL